MKQGDPASRAVAQATPASQDLVKFLTEMNEVQEVDPEAAAIAMIERILAAETVEDVFSNREATHARDILGVPIWIDKFDWQVSDFEDGMGAYCVLSCRRADVDPEAKLVVTCGARNVMATVWKLDQLGALPVLVRIMQASKTTRSGFLPLNLEPLESPNQF